MATRPRSQRAQRNLLLDIALAIAFVASLAPTTTGLALHEWLGLALGAGTIAHILVHRRWIVGVGRRLASPLPHRTRILFALNAALALAMLMLIGSGVLISRVALPLLGIETTPTLTLLSAHLALTWVAVGLLLVKLALHWRWIARTVTARRRAPVTAPQQAPILAAGRPRRLSRRLVVLGGSAAFMLGLVGWLGCRAVRDAPALREVPAREAAPPVEPTRPARCPFGLVNDPYPGRCNLYIDEDESGYCDLSEEV